jgi:pimeloyl-ACP methyl ester carboxylesterase
MQNAHDRIVAGGHALERTWHGPPPDAAPTLVFLHEGLGSVSMWRDFPRAIASATGYGALVYSRWGYGASDAVTLPRPLTYMHDEAVTLREVLAVERIRDAILIGHSDGGSIAIMAAADPRVRALVLEAPHVFCEDVSVRSIAAARDAYERTDLRARLARHHADVDGAFWGWNRAWLDPGFRAWNIESALPGVRVPTLVIQGADDEYGTLAQVDAIERGAGVRVERAILASSGHSPHRDQPEATSTLIVDFVGRVAR